jgi:hypothetical protein
MRQAAEEKGVARSTVFVAARAGLLTSARLDDRLIIRRDAAFDAWSPSRKRGRKPGGKKRKG